ncbi:phosphoribosylanthranilate isomerase [Flavobacteriaceae bacterium]|nr:phosphoribosylanthranilate isomerase [Flavobacteriaceae bacterium]
MKLKVCGMREKKNIISLTDLKPNYIGFIFWISSTRYVDQSTPSLPEAIKKTGVFVNATIDFIQSMVQNHQLKAVQLHGEETPDYCSIIQKFGVEVIKSFSIKDQFDYNKINIYEDYCDYYLFDTKGKLPGGNGYAFDWTLLNAYPSEKPFFLSGGIGPNELIKIKDLINTSLPLYAIDVNSKFEYSQGLKNIDLIRQFKKQLDEL